METLNTVVAKMEVHTVNILVHQSFDKPMINVFLNATIWHDGTNYLLESFFGMHKIEEPKKALWYDEIKELRVLIAECGDIEDLLFLKTSCRMVTPEKYVETVFHINMEVSI